MLYKKMMGTFGSSLQSKLHRKIGYGIRYSRKFFEEMEKNPEQIKKRQQQQLKKKTIFHLKGNQNNPDYVLKNIKNASTIMNASRQFDSKNQNNKCAILTPEPKKQKVLLTAIRKYIITSIKKARVALFPIRKMHIFDAIHILENSHKKVAKLMVPTLYNLISHALQKDKDPIRLYIHGYIIGKTRRFINLRYHAKGRRGLEKKDFCQVKIILEERGEEQFFADVGMGKASPGFATFIRQRLLDVNADYQKLSLFSGITTAKGRQQKKQIMKRKVDFLMRKNKEEGVFVPRKLLIQKLAQEQGEKAKEIFFNKLQKPDQINPLVLREQVYKKNLGIQ